MKKLILKLTKTEIATRIFNEVLEGTIRDEIDLEYFTLRQAWAKPNTPEKKSFIARVSDLKNKKELGQAMLEIVTKKLKQYERSKQ